MIKMYIETVNIGILIISEVFSRRFEVQNPLHFKYFFINEVYTLKQET